MNIDDNSINQNTPQSIPIKNAPELNPYCLSPYLKPLGADRFLVPTGISARHIHLTKEHITRLFGSGYKLQVYKPLSQPGQYAAQETLTIVGPKGVIENVRILGPERLYSQVEIARTDAYQLGVNPPPRDSGDIEGTPGIVLIGPHGSVDLENGVILAANHIHMHPNDALQVGLKDGERVQVLVDSERGTIFNNVLIRVSEQYNLEFHVDTDEANTALLENGDMVEIIARKLLM